MLKTKISPINKNNASYPGTRDNDAAVANA